MRFGQPCMNRLFGACHELSIVLGILPLTKVAIP